MVEHILKAGEKAWLWLSTLENSPLPHQRAERDKLQRGIYKLINEAYEDLCGLRCELWLTREPLPFAERRTGEYKELRLGEKWTGAKFDCAWMHITGQAPAGVDPADPALCILADISGEGLVYTKEGEAVQGITSYTSFGDFRGGIAGKRVVLADGLLDRETGRIDFWIDAAANDLLGNYYLTGLASYTLRKLHLARCDFEKRALFYDCYVLIGVFDINPRSAYTREVLQAVKRAVETGDRAILKPYLEAKNDNPDVFEYTAQGHSHLDLAWLWPIRETLRKGARTFASQIVNLRAYPEAIFGASQGQLYAWMKDRYPAIYAQVKELYQQGRWEIQGATWVEPDSNLIGGESLIRQFFYGKQYFREEFGFDPEILWLVDSFGYSACWPQVMALADVPYFLTQKMSWNTVNEFPYHTFHWKGLDGTPVLAHMLPENTYNAAARPDMASQGEKRYKERKVSRRAVSLFGIGDGGGGPGFEHYEQARRMADLKGVPKYTQGTIHGFFRKLAEEDDGSYPYHRGELYLEKHQGCYTTQARNKKYNRKVEFLLRNYELLVSMAGGWHATPTDLPISKAELDEIWREVLLYQFHDILPGSSINRVYEESQARYAVFTKQLEDAVARLAQAIYGGGAAVNLNSYDYQGLMQVDGEWRRVEIPAFGGASIENATAVTKFYAKAKDDVIENDCARVIFRDGVIVSYIHKQSGRELAEGPLNVFKLYQDAGDCWDIHPHFYYKLPHQTAKCMYFATGTDGAKAFARVEFMLGGDVINQEISLTDGSPLLRFSTKLARHSGKHVMLRVGFRLHMGPQASFNLPFGHLKRATTENNSIESAQFEVSGQKFVDLTDGDFGVSLLNDCKYGFRCKDGYLDIDLLRSPRGGPGRNVDFGAHSLEYALYPHEGPLGADTYAQAYFLNNPVLRTQQGESAAAPLPFLASSNVNIVIESVKVPEDGNGLLVRAYNSSEDAQSGEVKAAGHRALEFAGVMEEGRGPAEGTLEFHGFELKIIRFVKE
ncbi:MAG: alpha-mannosidase [Firmicutes bacterium]|nr:alpha-mannosidase [Bacillota bacterium]